MVEHRSKHNMLVDEVFDRLGKTGKYTYLEKFVQYNVDNLNGEVDILAYNEKQGCFHFYEIKTGHGENCGLNKAQRQFDRYKTAFNSRSLKGIYISPGVVKRLQ